MRSSFLSVFCAASFFIFNYAAFGSESYCTRPDIFAIKSKLYPDQEKSQKFEYRYQFIGSDQSVPVVIYLPGGPGMTSISNDPKNLFLPLPSTLKNIVYTDQRGTGCNPIDGENNSRDLYKSRFFAEDVVNLIKDLNRNGYRKYILYGHSFGTLHATKVAKLIQEKIAVGETFELPLAVVLEGIIGRQYMQNEALAAYQNEWEKVKNRLPLNVQSMLSVENPLGIPSENWGYFIMQSLYLGRMPVATGIKDLGADLMSISGNFGSPDFENLKAKVSAAQFTGFGPSFETITCQEFAVDFLNQPMLVNGKFQQKGSLCDGLKTTEKFDSSEYQIEVPIFYFQGTNDAATTMDQALYHYNHQRQPNKTFVTVGEAGHMPLQMSLFGCKDKLWDQIVHNQKLSSTDISSCKWAWEITLHR